MSVTVQKTEAVAFQQGFTQIAPQVRASLPSHIPFERFERVVMTAVQKTPDLLKADKRSLFLACQRAAQDGLMPDGREGALVMFGNQATWMPMVGGLMKLARNSGEIANISAHVVYEGEDFRVVLGDEERIEHERRLDLDDNQKIVAAYAVATLKSGEKVREVMTRAQIEKVRNVSRAKNGGPWTAWYDQMAIKTVIRRLSKRLPLSTDKDGDTRLRSAIEREDEMAVLDGRAEPAQHDAPRIASRLDALEAAVTQEDASPTPRPEETRAEMPAATVDACPVCGVLEGEPEADLCSIEGCPRVQSQADAGSDTTGTAPEAPPADPDEEWVNNLIEVIQGTETLEALNRLSNLPANQKRLREIYKAKGYLYKKVLDFAKAREAELQAQGEHA